MPKSMKSLFNITHRGYAMSTSNNEVEITMYGEIVETRPRDWWTDEPIDGDFIIQDEFLKDLDTALSSGAKKLKIRMNSIGGDCAVSLLIHNRLREAANNGIEISCMIDGVAMSGGSIIMCACDDVSVNPTSLVMIHKAWGFMFGGYNADELRAQAKSMDSWDKAQIEAYKRKTQLSETVISHMMSDTTYMTGREAVEKGFADTVIEDAEPIKVAASADRTSLYVNGRKFCLSKGMNIPDSIPVVTASEEEVIDKNPPEDETGNNEGGSIMANNYEELRTENPTLASQVAADLRAAFTNENAGAVNTAVEAERTRLSEIDEIAHLFDAETVREAKYGENPCTAQEMAFRAAQAAAKSGKEFMKNLNDDFKASGAEGVKSLPGKTEGNGGDKSPNEKMAEARTAVSALLHPEKK